MDNFLEKPLVFLDLETTDGKIASARIAEIALVKINGAGNSIEAIYHRFLNPTVPMTPEATAVNKLTDDFLKDHATFAQQAKGIIDFLSGCDLAGHNIMAFDIPVLVEEFLRVGIEFPEVGVQFVDTMAIQTKIMPRTLAAVYKFYTNEDLDPDVLHGAKSDALASTEIYEHQIKKYGDQLGTSRQDLHKISTFGKTIVDFAGKLTLNEHNQIVYNFGKNPGKKVSSDPGYASWMMDKGDFTFDTKRWVKHALRFEDEYYVSDKKRAEVEAMEAEGKRKREEMLKSTPGINFNASPPTEEPAYQSTDLSGITKNVMTQMENHADEINRMSGLPADLFPPK